MGKGTEDSDAEILARIRAGDASAFAVVVERYQRMILALARRMTGNEDDAYDVAQTTLMNAYRQIDGFRGDASLKTWLYGIALNECRMLHRKSGRTVSMDSIAEPTAPPSRGADALDRRVLSRHVARLPEKQRAAIVLRTVEDLSFREVGQVMGTSEASAKVNYFHAVKKLRGWLDPGPGGPSRIGRRKGDEPSD